MTNDTFRSLVTPFINSSSKECHARLHESLGRLRITFSDANFYSSRHALEVQQTCAKELRSMASSIWDTIVRVHKSQGSGSDVDLFAVFCGFLDAERAKIAGTQEQFIGPIISKLQNRQLHETQSLSSLQDELKTMFKAEVDIYLGTLKHGPATNWYDIQVHRFKNVPPIAIVGIIVAALLLFVGFIRTMFDFAAFVRTLF